LDSASTCLPLIDPPGETLNIKENLLLLRCKIQRKEAKTQSAAGAASL
jgi:hypothetical protein